MVPGFNFAPTEISTDSGHQERSSGENSLTVATKLRKSTCLGQTRNYAPNRTATACFPKSCNLSVAQNVQPKVSNSRM
eukprot:m.416218 g.416218  ORF g.416218 m.416218 type:complete len:78 (+) comp16830_c1_seq1:1931-2164(+)